VRALKSVTDGDGASLQPGISLVSLTSLGGKDGRNNLFRSGPLKVGVRAGTHRRITGAVAEALGIPGGKREILVEASAAPDLFPDYEIQPYLTRSGRFRLRSVRVRHHGTPPRRLRALALRARHLLLSSVTAPPASEAGLLRRWLIGTREKLERRAMEAAGRLLHYLQDGAVPSPSLGEEVHDRVERACDGLNPRQFVAPLPLPVGKVETLREMEAVRPSADPREAMREAVTYSFRVLGGLTGSLRAPEGLRKDALETCSRLRGSRSLLLHPLLSLVLLLALSLPFGSALLPLILLPFLLFLPLAGLAAASAKPDRVLRACRRLHGIAKKGCAWEVLCALGDHLLGREPVVAFSAILLLLLAWALFFRHPSWRRIREEVDWFLWE